MHAVPVPAPPVVASGLERAPAQPAAVGQVAVARAILAGAEVAPHVPPIVLPADPHPAALAPPLARGVPIAASLPGPEPRSLAAQAATGGGSARRALARAHALPLAARALAARA